MDNIKDILNVKDNYCVYFHKKKDTGEIFYIGSGRQNKREFNFNGRSNSWNAIKETNGVIVEIYAKNLNKTEARRLEEELINSKNYPNIVNIRKTINTDNSMSSDMFENYVYVDNTSKTGLKWKTKMGARGKIGTDAGNLTFDKMQRPRSITVKINGITYKASRIIWTLSNKFLESDMVIDHINNNPHDNSIENLRCVSVAENSRNRLRNHNFQNEHVGVHFHKHSKYPRFLASVSIDNKSYTKSFSVLKYGYEVALQKAIEWRSDMLKNLVQFGINYDKKHIPSK